MRCPAGALLCGDGSGVSAHTFYVDDDELYCYTLRSNGHVSMYEGYMRDQDAFGAVETSRYLCFSLAAAAAAATACPSSRLRALSIGGSSMSCFTRPVSPL